MNEHLNKNNIADMYPASPAQRGMLFHAAYTPESTLYLIQLTIPLSGELVLVRLQAAWDALVRDHPVLRTVFRWRNLDEPVQVVLKTFPVEVVLHDLSSLQGPDSLSESARIL